MSDNALDIKHFSELCNRIFTAANKDYHLKDDVNADIRNPYDRGSIEYLLYMKNWIDVVQWHLEDIIRDPRIEPMDGIALKRRIDRSNQERTDLVEQIDEYFYNGFSDVKPLPTATVNTESPAWAVDRLSILILKLYHTEKEVQRTDATKEHIAKCKAKLAVLQEQHKDLSLSIDQLLADIAAGTKLMKVYKQMKMYNDPTLNPILYNKK